MNAVLLAQLFVFMLAVFVGIEVISKVPVVLHTPLMSGTNAIHGIVIVGALFVAGAHGQDTLTQVIGFIAVVLASANVVGGFVVIGIVVLDVRLDRFGVVQVGRARAAHELDAGEQVDATRKQDGERAQFEVARRTGGGGGGTGGVEWLGGRHPGVHARQRRNPGHHQCPSVCSNA